eukprot:5960347-Pyramimonas_sp.AAC.1
MLYQAGPEVVSGDVLRDVRVVRHHERDAQQLGKEDRRTDQHAWARRVDDVGPVEHQLPNHAQAQT